ncbi:MAG: ATP-binding protein [Acholeplasmataceae bacterium]|nr:ATP-binding protein [Acholeplasmataceae bacterium]
MNDNYISRHLEEQVVSLSKEYAVILITGPRQVGKTRMLTELQKKENKGRTYVSLDDFNTRELAKTDPALFLELYKPPVIIDEVQYAPELFTYIKIYVDENYNPGDFWLTGSQVFSLMKGVKESLAGRVAILNMTPLSRREIIGVEPLAFKVDFDLLLNESKKMDKLSLKEVYESIWVGSMPGVISRKYTNLNIFYSSYISTYINRDVRDISSTVDVLKFNKFIIAIAARTSQLLNYSSLAVDVDIDVKTAKSWINILETLGIIFLIYPYSNNILKRTIKTPKVYFYDTGLVSHLTGWLSAEVLEKGAMSGAIFENYVISEIIKNYYNKGIRPRIYFYRDVDGKEIDIILERDGKLYPIEIKKSASPTKKNIKTFNVLEKSPLEIGTSAVLCMKEELSAFDAKNLIVPIWLI